MLEFTPVLKTRVTCAPGNRLVRERIDKLLVDRGFAASRVKAQALIMAGLVLVNEQRVDKPSQTFAANEGIRVKGTEDPAFRYVGRGGLKLQAALLQFSVDVHGLVCMDIGASTGGFTDCLLQHGASRVIAVDSGQNQLDWSLRSDPRVEVHEKTNARYLEPEAYGIAVDLIVIDVSFISVTKILSSAISQLKPDGRIITLIKPQFEVGRTEVGKGGIVTDPEKHNRVIDEVTAAASLQGLNRLGIMDSPITGMDGNREFLAIFERSQK